MNSKTFEKNFREAAKNRFVYPTLDVRTGQYGGVMIGFAAGEIVDRGQRSHKVMLGIAGLDDTTITYDNNPSTLPSYDAAMDVYYAGFELDEGGMLYGVVIAGPDDSLFFRGERVEPLSPGGGSGGN